MSEQQHHVDTDGLSVKVEPDNVPTRMLTTLAVAVTIVVVGLVVFANVLFDKALAEELTAKGYASTEPVPADHGGAAPWNNN